MKRHFTLLTIALILVACGEESKKYHAAQQLGEKHAKEIVKQELTDNQLAIKLLEVRAKEHTIRTQINDQAAKAYIQAFTSYIKLNDDSLASIIFINDSISTQQ